MIQNLRSSVSSPLNGKNDNARFSINESLLNQDIPNQVKGQNLNSCHCSNRYRSCLCYKDSAPITKTTMTTTTTAFQVLPFEFCLKSSTANRQSAHCVGGLRPTTRQLDNLSSNSQPQTYNPNHMYPQLKTQSRLSSNELKTENLKVKTEMQSMEHSNAYTIDGTDNLIPRQLDNLSSNRQRPTVNRQLITAFLFSLIFLLNNTVWGQTNYYSKSSGNLNLTTSWGTNTDGSGTAPSNFTTANCIYNIRNNSTPTIGANWTVSGTGSKVVVGDGTNACTFTIPSTFTYSSTATDISASATLRNQNTSVTSLGTCSVVGTYEHNANGGTIPTATWQTNSTCNVTGSTSTTDLSGLGQTFYNFIYNCSGGIENINTGAFNVTNTFLMPSTNAGTVRIANSTTSYSISIKDFSIGGGTFQLAGPLTSSSTQTLAISGNLSISGGTLDLSASSTGTGTLTVAGNFTHSGGTIQKTNGTGSITLNGTTGTQTLESTGQTNTAGSSIAFNVAGSNAQCVISASKTFTLSSGSTFAITNGTAAPDLSISGTFVNSGTITVASSPTWTVNNGGNFIQNTTTAISTPFNAATFSTGSTVTFRRTSANPTITLAGRTYHHLVFESLSGTLSSTGNTGTSALIINGNLTLGANCTVEFNMTASPGHSIKGNISVGSGSTLTFNPAAAGTFNINGSSTQTISGAGTITTGLNSTLLVGATSTIDFGATAAIAGSGTFQTSSGSTLITANTLGINGSLTLSTRTLNAGTNYIFNNSVPSAQVTGAALTSANNLTINNSAGVSLSGNTAVTGTLTLSNGKLNTNNYTLTLSNSATGSASSYILASAAGPVTMNSVSTSKTIPIGTSSSYAPIIVSASSATNYSAYVVSTLPCTAIDATKVVNLAWGLSGLNTPSSVTFQWNSGNQASSFVPANTCEIASYSASCPWSVTSLSAASGSGPYTLNATTGLSSGSNIYAIGNLYSLVAGPATPSAPTINSITPGNQQLSVNFSAPSSDGGSAITNYKYSINGGSSFTAVSPASTSSPIVITGLTNGTSYNVQILAVNAAGDGTASSTTSATPTSGPTVPGVPTITSITPGNGQLSVAFSAGTDGGSAITNYKYSINGGSSFTAVSPASTASPILITGLTNGTSYNVQIQAVNGVGEGPATASTAATPRTTAGAPSITGITPGNAQLSVAFTAPTSDGGSTITTYKYSTDGGSTWQTRASGTTATPIVITTLSTNGTTALTNGTSYDVQIRAVNAAGDGTASSTTAATPRTTPGAPSITGITPSNQQLSVAFTAPASDGGSAITTYKYSTDGGTSWQTRASGTTGSPLVITTLSTNGTTALTNGISYNVQIRAVNAAGDGTATSSTAATPATTPGAPTITGITPGNAQLSVAFTAPASTGGSAITTYQYSTDGGTSWQTRASGTTASPIVITTLSTNGTTALVNETTYNVQIRAVNAIGSGTATATTQGKPTLYCIPTGSTSSSTYISAFSTTNGVTNISNTSTTYSSSGYGNFSNLSVSQYPNTAVDYSFTLVGGTAGVAIWVDWNNDGDFLDTDERVYVSNAYLNSGTRTGSITVPSGQTAGNYRMRIIADYGIDVPTSCVNATVFSGSYRGEAEDYTFTVVPQSAPSAPTITSVTAGNGQLSVAFTAPASNGGAAISNYKYSTNGGSSFTAVSPASTSSPIVITGLTNGTSYNIVILAVNSVGDGASSNTVSGTPIPPTVAGAPTITGITAGNNQLSIAFTAPASNGGAAITNYKYSTNGGSSFTAVSPASTSSPIVITGLTNGTSYNIVILAVNSVGDGASSNTVSATPGVVYCTPTGSTVSTNYISSVSSTCAIANTTNTSTYSTAGYGDFTNISFSQAAGTSFSVLVNVTGGPSGVSIFVDWNNDGDFTDAGEEEDYSANVTSSTFTVGVPVGQALGNYRMRIVADYISSRPTSCINGQITGGGRGEAEDYTLSIVAATTPGAPVVSHIVPSNGQLSVNFSSCGNGGSTITNYKYSTDGGITWALRQSGTISSPLVITNLSSDGVTPLSNNVCYSIQIRAVNSLGDGTPSSSITSMPSATTSVYWNFGTSSGVASATSGVPSNVTISALSQVNNLGSTTMLSNTSASTTYTNASGQFNASACAQTGVLNINSSTYFQFTITPGAGYQSNLSAIGFGSRSTSTGPVAYSLRSSLDNYAADIATGTMTNTSVWAEEYNSCFTSISNTGSAVVYRIYGYDGSGNPTPGTANWRIDDLKLTLEVSCVAPSSQTASATAASVCSGSATTISLSGSQTGVSYQLRNNADNTNIGSPVSGTGSAISFSTGNLSENTTFNVLATSASCGATTVMSGTPTVTVNTCYTITYDANGGTGTVSSSSHVAGSSATLASGSALARLNFNFIGWNTAANGSGTFYLAGASFTVNVNTTLYARWATTAAASGSKFWVGGTGNWNVAGNWNPSGVPGASDNIYIDAGTPVMNTSVTIASGTSLTIADAGALTINPNVVLTISGNADFGDLPVTLKSDATGTASIGQIANDGANLTGASAVTVERYMPGQRKWRMLTAPLTGGANNSIYYNWQNNGNTSASTGAIFWGPAASGGIYPGGTGYNILRFNSSTGNQGAWENVTSTTTAGSLFDASTNKSYIAFVTGPYNTSGNYISGSAVATTLRATGTLRTGQVQFTGLTGGVGLDARFHMIGNPYASAVSFSAINAQNVNGFYYVWNPGQGTLGGYVPIDRTDVTKVLESGQAFLVAVPDGSTGSVTFDETDKSSTTTNAMFRTQNTDPRATMKLYKTVNGTLTLFDQAWVDYQANANPDLDGNDALKPNNFTENMSIYRFGKDLMVERRPIITQNDTLQLRLWRTQNTNYQLQLTMENFSLPEGSTAVLEDLYLKTSTPLVLSGQQTINFSVNADAASSGERFRIVFRPSVITSVNNLNGEKGFSVYPNPLVKGTSMQLEFRNRVAGKYTITLFTIAGVQVQQSIVTHGGGNGVQSIAISSRLSSGAYIAEITGANGIKEKMKVVVE